MPGFKVTATVKGPPPNFWRRLWEAVLDFLKHILGKKFIAAIVGAALTTWLVTWNASHGKPLDDATIKTVVESIVVLVLAFLGFQTSADQSKALAESVPAAAHVEAVKAAASQKKE